MSVQTTYTSTLTAKFEGRLESGRLNSDILSAVSKDAAGIAFGRACSLQGNDSDQLYLAISSQAVLTLDADLITSNTLAGNIIIGTTENATGTTTAYSELYATSHTATLASLASTLDALTGVSAVSDPTARTITVTADAGYWVYFSTGAVTGGASQANVALSNSDAAGFAGTTMQTDREPADGQTAAQYQYEDVCSVVRKGRIDMRSEDALAPGDAVYVRIVPGASSYQEQGMLMDAADTNKGQLWAGASVYRGCSAGGIATIEINLP